jgi:hypothetical protein
MGNMTNHTVAEEEKKQVTGSSIIAEAATALRPQGSRRDSPGKKRPGPVPLHARYGIETLLLGSE